MDREFNFHIVYMCTSLLDIDTLHVLLMYTLPIKYITLACLLFCFPIQDNLSLCPNPGIINVSFPCFTNFTWLQLISYLNLFVPIRTCCMLWAWNIYNRYIRLHQVYLYNLNLKSKFACEFTILFTHLAFLSLCHRTIHMLPEQQ